MARIGKRYQDQRNTELQANYNNKIHAIARNPEFFGKKIHVDEETTLTVTPAGNPSGSRLRVEIDHNPIAYRRGSPIEYDHSSEERTAQILRNNLEQLDFSLLPVSPPRSVSPSPEASIPPTSAVIPDSAPPRRVTAPEPSSRVLQSSTREQKAKRLIAKADKVIATRAKTYHTGRYNLRSRRN